MQELLHDIVAGLELALNPNSVDRCLWKGCSQQIFIHQELSKVAKSFLIEHFRERIIDVLLLLL